MLSLGIYRVYSSSQEVNFLKILWLEKCPTDFGPVVFKGHVDDTSLLFQNMNQIEQFKHYLNLQHANIKFTSETEMNSSLSFLDSKIVREHNKFNTLVYRKPTFSGLFTKLQSFISNFANTPLFLHCYIGALKICSKFELFHQEI